MKEIEWNTVIAVIIGIIILLAIWWGYMKFFAPMPAGALTQAQYDALSAAEKATYKQVGNYYVKA